MIEAQQQRRRRYEETSQTDGSRRNIGNSAKHDEWNDLDRFPPQNGNGSSHDATIEHNSCLLEDLLTAALEYDARLTAAKNNETNVGHTSIDNVGGPDDVFMSPTLRYQIRKYVSKIGSKYHNVGFHSFEHASHVMISATKIVYMLQDRSPLNRKKKKYQQRDEKYETDQHMSSKHDDKKDDDDVSGTKDRKDIQVHNLTGTIFDPWLHFSIVFSALIHDVDHKGLPNNQLAAESDPLSVKYGSEVCLKSYAEWNSLDIGLRLLDEDSAEYGEFTKVLFGEGDHKKERFYKMVTDLVLCTDIASKERREIGMQKWEKARCTPQYKGNEKLNKQNHQRGNSSTVVIDNTISNEDGVLLNLHSSEAAETISEQIMQVADVSHTMQHFSTFMKWNSHLYHEILAAYQCGRCQMVPSSEEVHHPKEKWYESQIGFFDYYIIPLAERLDASELFLAEKHTFSSLAVENKEKWIMEGKECTQLMVQEAERMELPPPISVIPHNVSERDEMMMERVGNKMSAITVNKNGDDMSTILDDCNTESSSIVALMPGEKDDNSIYSTPGTIETAVSGNVSFAGGSRTSKQGSESLAKWEKNAPSGLSGCGNDVDCSVNAIVPHILVKQLIDSLQNDIHCVPIDLRMNALRGALSKYQSVGSIQRHRGALLFVDISGFTKLSQMYPVEDFKTFINIYFTKIINLVINFGGEVVKFAGDALYIIWTTRASLENDNEVNHHATGSDNEVSHAMNIEKCTACAIAISMECNNYKVSKSYNKRSSAISSASSNSSYDGRDQGDVLYRIQDKNAEYEERGTILNVHCGVAEGIMAGVDVVSNNRAEFFLVGKPLKDVAKAEQLAGPGELVVSPSVYSSLKKKDIMLISFKLAFTSKDKYQRVDRPNHLTIDDMLIYFKEKGSTSTCKRDAQSLIDGLFQHKHSTPKETDFESSFQSDLMRSFECHRHEAARDVVGKFTAELRRVVILFISIMYEPDLSEDPSEDDIILHTFQSIFSILTLTLTSSGGQVRQFINDEKGTVFIASFGLRGSVILHPCDNAVTAAKEAQKKLFEIMGIKCSIGITLGKVFCGETGSFQRYEYSLLGPSVNLSARLMAKSSWGQINCDTELKNHAGRRHTFTISGTHHVKGYEMPVPFFMPDQDEEKKHEEREDVVTFFMQNAEVLFLVAGIINTRKMNSERATKVKPSIILIEGDAGKGKNEFISGILKHPNVRNSSVILEANRCFHDDPFYCFIPIVTRILLSFVSVQERLISLQKSHKKSSVLASFLANPAFETSSFPRGTDIVPIDLIPYLSLANGFVFKGFPLIKSSMEVKGLKESEKVEKYIEVLSALIVRYFELQERPGILAIYELDSIDSYSQKLIRQILSSNANLIIIGGADDSPVHPNEEPTLGEKADSFLVSILGEGSDMHVNVVRKNLQVLDKQSTFDLFLWSLRRDFSLEECVIIDRPEIHDKIFQLCNGMTHAVAQLAHTFCTQYHQKEHSSDFLECTQIFLNKTPTDFEEIIWFRIDQMKDEEQMLLKIASVAGFDQYSFSRNLLETVFYRVSQNQNTATTEDRHDFNHVIDNFRVPSSVGSDVPTCVGTSEENRDYFEQLLDSLVAHNFLDEINVEMRDLSSMDSVYRFRNDHEQQVINGLMLNDQKKRTHFEVAAYYSSSFQRGGGESLGDNDSSSSISADMTSTSGTNWAVFHIIAIHYDLADVPIPAMIHYFDSSASLASLGVRDKAHGRLLSAYVCLEKILHHASGLDVKVDESVERRRHIANMMIRTIGGNQLKENVKVLTKLTKEHLRVAFDGDIFAVKKSLGVLQKFGQSVGTIEKSGYLFGSELYIRAILLLLLVLGDDAFANLTSNLGSFLEQLDIKLMTEDGINEDSLDDESCSSRDSCFVDDIFFVDDVTASFPAFSGLLTFYRDSPIGANQVQETFLANLFVAVTKEANQTIHVLRTKCILSHLYLKHGNITKALEECEEIKAIYDHDRYSPELVNIYGMDWPLVCVATMASTYLFKGQFAAARHNIEFLKTQMSKLDEFASSTKAMSKATISSLHLLLREFDAAVAIAKGINSTKYFYFYKPIGVLQEKLANREFALNHKKTFAHDLELLSILSSDGAHKVYQSRSMLEQSTETLTDRGISAIQAALCETEILNIELQPKYTECSVKKQIQYCEAGLLYLRDSISQNDARNHERRKNYLQCLYQQAGLLCWHHKLLQLLQKSFDIQVDDTLGINGTEIDNAKKSLDECRDLSEIYCYPFMQLLAGERYVKLGLDKSGGERLIQHALECINDDSDRQVAKTILSLNEAQSYS